MTVEQFRELVWNMARTEGTPYLTIADVADLNALIGEILDSYTSKVQCLQSDNITFTPIVGQATYDTSQTTQVINGVTTTVFSSRVCFVRQVYINGSPLRICGDEEGRPGESSEATVAQAMPGYLFASNDNPAYWWQESPNNLRFNCPFDQAYPNCKLSGRLYHSAITSDGQTIELSSEDIQIAGLRAAQRLLMPYSRAAAVGLEGFLEAKEKERIAACTVKTTGHTRRGPTNHRKTLNLSR